ncbi:uncharacterized protein NFIA_057820 [Aspergillus fischeri NRRL 181]|uniref:Deoxyribonuclease NucA/NucB domain-containing protein n=1 Tax=Neosartorya fischeri (strain ATCC 1020 / DSM 3700 / CBS 544.65 / FGSC A1164 / JCM 1740 / NRRL 181 / WB 181) TaxID=331117 RepID=A1DNR1_NEOFI|nr:uncharacterized protein NFIA_057820 [Aspergillus fischeri NRRL 181]EAW16432.1 hypothetical protein NFIA_057820 [Aspergillus fischeri NRRL 181]
MLFKYLVHQLSLLFLCLFPVFAAPVIEPTDETGLVARTGNTAPGGSKGNPKAATFDITGWEDIAEEDCYVMLCLKDGERTWQRNPTTGLRETHYASSGARAKPFRKDNVPKRHTGQINSQPGSSETNSAEEFPWESTVQGGSNALLLPATRAQQQRQAGAITAGFRRSDITLGEWFRITFSGNLGEICRALHQEPPDDSICKKPTVTVFGKKVNLNDWVWTMAKVGGSLAYYHAAGSSKGKIGKRMDSIEMRFLHSKEGNLNEGRAETLIMLHISLVYMYSFSSPYSNI